MNLAKTFARFAVTAFNRKERKGFAEFAKKAVPRVDLFGDRALTPETNILADAGLTACITKTYSARELLFTSSLSTIASAISFIVLRFWRLWR